MNKKYRRKTFEEYLYDSFIRYPIVMLKKEWVSLLATAVTMIIVLGASLGLSIYYYVNYPNTIQKHLAALVFVVLFISLLSIIVYRKVLHFLYDNDLE